MKSGKNIIRLLAVFLLAATLVGCFAACTKKKKGKTEDVTTKKAAPEESPFLFDQTDYNDDFYCLRAANAYKDFFFNDTGSTGRDYIEAAIAERDAMVLEFLGVTVHSKTKEGLEYAQLVTEIRNQNMNNTKEYDALLTHSYLGITTFITEGLLADYYDMEDIDLEADYWNINAIEELEVQGHAYLALNDFMINSPNAVLFNKRMLDQFNINEDLYELVRDGEWTMDKLFEISSKVAVENGDDKWDKNDTYGLALQADWYALSFVDSCDVEWLTPGPGYRLLTMGPDNHRYQTLYEKVEQLADAQSTYMWNYRDSENEVKITDDRFLFALAPVKNTDAYQASEVDFGFLPYPKLDEDQANYRSFDWSGMLCVPKLVKNAKMTAQTLECLAAFSTDTVRPAFYERLLGVTLAEAPDDAEMLTKYIFGNIVLNPVINFETKANEPLGILVYTIPKMLRAKVNKTDIYDITYNWNTYGEVAQKGEVDVYINKSGTGSN